MTKKTEHIETWALVPMKSLTEAKHRLSGIFNLSERRDLSLAMLSDVLTTLKQISHLASTAVITHDPLVLDLAHSWNTRVLKESKTGVNAAVTEAAKILSLESCTTMLVVPGDVPLATPEEFSALLEVQNPGATISIATDHRGTGTNALACSPPTVIAPCFGQRSLVRHQEAARNVGTVATVLELPGLALDIDIPDDIARLLEKKPQGHTYAFLRKVVGETLYQVPVITNEQT